MTEEYLAAGDMEEVFEEVVNAMESEGIDFKEEVGHFSVDIPSRPDLSFTVYIVDKNIDDVFSKYEGFH